MHYFFISCIWTMFTSCLTFAYSPDLFTSGADDIGTDESLTMNDNVDVLSSFANLDGSSILDDSDLFSSDPSISSNSNVFLADEGGSNFPYQSFADLNANNDPSLFLVDTSSLDSCLSPASKLRKVRMRSESCPDSEPQQPSEADEAVQERIRKRWCSFKDQLPVGQYPVCRNGERNRDNLVPNRPSPGASLPPLDRVAPYRNIIFGTLSKYFSSLLFFFSLGKTAHNFLFRTHIHMLRKKAIHPP